MPTSTLRTDDAELHFSLGLSLAHQGDREQAVTEFRRAIHAEPCFAQAHHNLGIALAECRQYSEAIESLEAAVTLQPGYAEAFYNLGTVWNCARQPENAITAFRQALALRPNHPETLNNLGLVLASNGSAAEAIVLLRHALRLRPDFPEALNNLGIAYTDVGNYEDAQTSLEAALRHQPQSVNALNNLGTNYKEQGDLTAALACYDLALAYDCEHVSTRWNRAICLLQYGDYAQGWHEYEWRRRKSDHGILVLKEPYWTGGPVSGKTILLHAEQGRGDTIQFIRYAAVLRQRGATVLFLCPHDLADLLRNCEHIDHFLVEGEPLPSFDAHASLLSLPALLELHEPCPADFPYLIPDEHLVATWRARLDALPGVKIGIAWQGNPRHKLDHHRSIALTDLERLARIPNITLISLQRGAGTEQITAFQRRHHLVTLDMSTDQATSYAVTAAIIANLRCVVAIDSAVAHMAGALGVDVLVALSARSDWRWRQGRRDTDWYPSMTLYRQECLGQWAPVIAGIVRHLRGMVRTERPHASPGSPM